MVVIGKELSVGGSGVQVARFLLPAAMQLASVFCFLMMGTRINEDMGWDLYIVVDTGGDSRPSVGQSFNYTHNCNQMLRKAGIYWPDHEGKTMEEFAPILKNGIEYMKANREDLEKLNPDNGWGSYESLLKTVEAIYQEFSEHPKALLHASM